jgi:carboxyl-terminal processing protease
VEVDGENIAGTGLKNTDVAKKLRGPKGTQVNVKVLRRDEPKLLDFTITRDKIPLYSIDAKYWAAPGVAYIKLNRFSNTSHEEFVKALKELGKKPEGIILDLRGNSGGVFETSIFIADEFLKKGEMVVYTEGRAIPKMDAKATDSLKLIEKGKLVVLIDEQSASASEIVAGAIQDWDRGLLIGRRTFGKGLVQNQSELPDGSLIRITVARYHTPTGRIIQRPYDKGNADKYHEDMYKRLTGGEMYHLDSIVFSDSLKYQTLKNKRTVYGGGGIMPDIFVPVDTTNFSMYHSRLVRRGILNQFSLRYADSNRKQLAAKYPTFKEFNDKFEVSDSLFNQLVDFAVEQKLEKDEEGIAKAKNNIEVQLKGLIAQDLFTINEYYEVVYPAIDNEYQKALEVITSWKKYENLLEGEKASKSKKKK